MLLVASTRPGFLPLPKPSHPPRSEVRPEMVPQFTPLLGLVEL